MTILSRYKSEALFRVFLQSHSFLQNRSSNLPEKHQSLILLDRTLVRGFPKNFAKHYRATIVKNTSDAYFC